MTAAVELTPKTIEWLEALESGKHKQARGRLKRGDGLCCLGVAAVVCGVPFETASETDEVAGRYRHLIPLTLAGVQECITMNDDERKTFRQIAAEIRANPSRFFGSQS